MSWLALLRLFLSLANKIFDFVEREGHMSAGEARALAAQMEELNERMQKAVAARAAVAADTDGLRDDDGYRRD